jgi:hypothetical protein
MKPQRFEGFAMRYPDPDRRGRAGVGRTTRHGRRRRDVTYESLPPDSDAIRDKINF